MGSDVSVSNTRSPSKVECQQFMASIETGDAEAVEDWLRTFSRFNTHLKVFKRENPGPLCRAVEHGHEDIFDILIRYGFDPNKANPKKHTKRAIHIAALKGHIRILEKLIDIHNIPVDTRLGGFQWTPLICAILSKKENAVKFLISKNADVNYKCGNHPVIEMCSRWGSAESLNEVLKAGADVNTHIFGFHGTGTGSALNEAAWEGRTDIVRVLCDHGARVDIPFHGSPILHIAINRKVNISIIKCLLKLNPLLHAVDDDGFTAVQSSFKYSSLQVPCLKLLLEAGYKVSQRDYDMALSSSFTEDDTETILSLLSNYLREPRTLKETCCFAIREILGPRVTEVGNLPLPEIFQKYLALDHILS